MSSNADAALQHLRDIRPDNGWGIERKNNLVRLTRRNVPLTDAYFLDLHHDASSSGAVVGILSGVTRADGTVQSQVLVDASGKPSGRSVSLLGVKYSKGGTARTSRPRNNAASTANRSSSTRRTNNTSLSDEQNRDIFKYGVVAIGCAVAYRVLVSSTTLLFLVLPLAYLYLVTNCPRSDSFDAKKELKRILRGHHLPEDHPEKPRGFLSETLARIQATVATEIATIPGYEIQMTEFGGVAILAIARVPSVETEYYWVGAANKWWFIFPKSMRSS